MCSDIMYMSSTRRRKERMPKLFFGQKCEIMGTQITFDMFCAVKALKDLKLKARSEFPNVWAEYKES